MTCSCAAAAVCRERESARVKQTAQAVAQLDVLCSFAAVAVHNHYCKPEVDLGNAVSITAGRHPVVEQMLKNALFVPNDTLLGSEDCRTAIITGPNMAGKSTYMRQVALIVLMAQMGAFVPAQSAQHRHRRPALHAHRRVRRSGLRPVDLHGRDDRGRRHSQKRDAAFACSSSTRSAAARRRFDGMAIASAVLEYAADRKRLGAKTLFATHYHELTDMEQDAARRQKLQHRRQEAAGRHDLPAQDRPRRGRRQLRHRGRQACRHSRPGHHPRARAS